MQLFWLFIISNIYCSIQFATIEDLIFLGTLCDTKYKYVLTPSLKELEYQNIEKRIYTLLIVIQYEKWKS